MGSRGVSAAGAARDDRRRDGRERAAASPRSGRRWPPASAGRSSRATTFIPQANVAKMAAGTPLTDDDRWPWLDRLAAEMAAIDGRGDGAVLACSALKQAYRDRIARAGRRPLRHFRRRDTIAARLAARPHHYMPPRLLASQFATLEPPPDAIVVDARRIADEVARIRDGSASRPRNSTGSPKRPHESRQLEADHPRRTPRPHPENIWGRSTRRCFARRRCSSRRSPRSSGGAGEYEASGMVSTGCRPSPTCRTRSRPSKAPSPRSPFLRASRRRRCRCWRSSRPAIMRSSPTPSTVRHGGSATATWCASASRSRTTIRCGRGNRAGIPVEHELVFAESPGSLTFERAGHPGDRGRRAPARRARRDRQFVGDAVRLPLVRPWRRRIGARSDQVHRRPFGRAVGLILANEATFPALHRLWTDLGVTASSDDCFLGLRGFRTLPLRLARHGERPHDAQWLRRAPKCARSSIRRCPAHGVMTSGGATSSAARGCSRRAAAGREDEDRCDAGRDAPLRDGLELGRLRKPRDPDLSGTRQTATRWNAGGPCLRLAIGLEDPDDLIADLSEGLGRLAG